jgi:hypothetical protein
MKRIAASLISCLVVGFFACKKSEPPPPPPPPVAAAPAPAETPAPAPAPVSVTAVTLGSAIGADKKVTTPTETFVPKDTIYAVVETSGQGHAKLRALWTFVRGEKTAKVDESALEFESTAPAVNEFHVTKPSGWPKGDYKVEIFLDDAPAPAATKTFKVG